MRKITIISIITVICIAIAGMAFAQTPEESLKKDFPMFKAKKISQTNLKGLYEVILDDDVLYYIPETHNVIFGDMFTKEKRNLTQEKRSELRAAYLDVIKQKQKEIPLEKAVKIGSGPHTVIEFSSPDCGYCRKSSAYMKTRTDLTRYIFFIALAPSTEAKIKYILCAKDRAKAYEEAMTGRLDNGKFSVCEDKAVDQLYKEHQEIARGLSINSTPFFFIDGQIVQGADMPAIEKLLGKK